MCEETKLIEFLIENLISFDPKEKTIKFQKTYVGHLINLANLLNDPKLESNTDLTKFLSENEEWQEFISTKLIIINQIHNSDLGGHNPRKPSKLHYQQEKEELDDFDLLFIDNNRANNQENSYDAHDKYGIEEYQFDEPDYEIENHDDIPDFLMKYEPEVEENLLNEQFDFVGAQISGITSKE